MLGGVTFGPPGATFITVLTGPPVREGAVDDEPRRRMTQQDPLAGKRWADVQDQSPSWGKQFTWFNRDRAGTAELLNFLDYTSGRAAPFWMPSWDRDLVVHAAAAAGASSVVIKSIGYAGRLFAAGTYRRNLMLRTHPAIAEVRQYVHVDAAVDHGDGTETLTLHGPLDFALVPGEQGSRLSFLRYCRLDTDQLEIVCHGPKVSVCTFPVRELPKECP